MIRRYEVNGQALPLPVSGQLILDETSRAFSMQVAALNINSNFISYEYKLAGQDNDWLALDVNSRWIQYTNLSPGQYRLEVKGRYPYDEGTVTPLSIAITVTPAFWQTAWFKLGLAVLLLLFVHVFIRWRIKFLKAKALQLEQMVVHKSQELDAVNAIGREFTTHLTLNDVFQEIYQHIGQIVSVDAFGIGLIDQQHSTIVFEYAIEQDVRFNQYTRSLEHPEQLAVFCVQQNRSILIKDYNQEYEQYHPIRDERLQMLCNGTMGKSASSMIYVPMAIQRKVIGVIGMQSFSPDIYSKSDVTILETLASYGAIALANAKSHENLQSLHQQLEASHNELKQTQQKLIMQEKMAALGQLVAGVAHEINTPVGIAVTGISVLDDKLTELESFINDNRLKRNTLENNINTCIESLALIKPNLNKTAELIQQFKRVAAADSNAKIISVDIGELLRQVSISVIDKSSDKGISVELAGPESLKFDTMPSVLSQVILILINNALQHAFSERSEGKIILRYSLDNKGLTIACEDNGAGISAEQEDQIFAPFYTSSRQSGAMGLGLSIAFNIVNIQLAGTLTLKSDYGKGATFIVKVPL